MSTAIAALFASALHEARAIEVDDTGLDHVSRLLCHAGRDGAVVFEQRGGELSVNGVPLPATAPGSGVILIALTEHMTARLRIAPGAAPAHWRAVAELYATARGLYPTPQHIMAALAGTAPGADMVPAVESGNQDLMLQESLLEIPGRSPLAGVPITTDPALVSRNAERAELSGMLDPLLNAGKHALEIEDWEALATVMLGLHELEGRSDEATRAIILRERRRIVPTTALEMLVRLLPKFGAGSPVMSAVASTGIDGAEAIAEILSEGPSKQDRRIYLETLASSTGAEEVILRALTSPRSALARDAAIIAGRRRMPRAVPALTGMMRHPEEEVRTAAWHALEQIGNDDANSALRRGR
jgi:hypothetical protein